MIDLQNEGMIEVDNSNTQLMEDYDFIMNGFDDNNPLLHNQWEMDGGVFKKFSLYDSTSVCISGVL